MPTTLSRIGKFTSFIFAAHWLLVGCASGPRGSYFDLTESARHAAVLPTIPPPRIAVVGILVEEHGDKDRHERLVHTNLTEVSPLIGLVSDGLQASAVAIPFSAVAGLPVGVDCAAPGPNTMTDPEDAPCRLPKRLSRETSFPGIDLRTFTHALLVVGWTSITKGQRQTTWGIGPGGAPAVTAETDVTVYVKVAARLYDIQTGAVVTYAAATDGGSGAYGVMLTLLPFYDIPNQGSLLEATGRAVGVEIGRRLIWTSPERSRGPQ